MPAPTTTTWPSASELGGRDGAPDITSFPASHIGTSQIPKALTASSEGHYELAGNSSGDNLKTITQVDSAASSIFAASWSVVAATPRDDWIDGNETDDVTSTAASNQRGTHPICRSQGPTDFPGTLIVNPSSLQRSRRWTPRISPAPNWSRRPIQRANSIELVCQRHARLLACSLF